MIPPAQQDEEIKYRFSRSVRVWAGIVCFAGAIAGTVTLVVLRSWEGVGGLAASPLVVAEATTGALLVGRLAPAEAYPPSVAEVLGSFASQASIALEKAHLYAESQQQVQRLSRLLEELHSAQTQLAQSRPSTAPNPCPGDGAAAEAAATLLSSTLR